MRDDVCPPWPRPTSHSACDHACMQVFAQLMGDLPLPWEGELGAELQRRLGAFKGPVLQLLHRDPTHRIALRRFHNTCNRLFANRTTVEA